MSRKKADNETPAKTKATEKTPGVPAPEPTEPTPAPDEKKSKKGKVEMAADATPDAADEATSRLEDARNEAVNNHARQNS